MGSSLVPVLAEIYLNDFEKIYLHNKNLIEKYFITDIKTTYS